MKRIIITLCMIFVILAQGTVSFAGIIPDQVVIENESSSRPNNTREGADKVSMVDWTSHYIFGVVSSSDQEDWFQIQTNQYNGEGVFHFTEGSSVNSDIYLYDQNGNYISSAVGSDDKINNTFIRANSIYYLRVKHISGSAIEPYEIQYYVQ